MKKRQGVRRTENGGKREGLQILHTRNFADTCKNTKNDDLEMIVTNVQKKPANISSVHPLNSSLRNSRLDSRALVPGGSARKAYLFVGVRVTVTVGWSDSL
jgi:hypothetical protein